MNAPTKTSKLIKGATGDWEVVIGMEIHAQVSSAAKLFSGAATAFRRLAEGLDTAIVRVVAARPGTESITAVMEACQPTKLPP